MARLRTMQAGLRGCQEEFAVRVAEEYKKAETAGEIDRALFTPQFRSFLDPMVENPAAFAVQDRKSFPEIVWAEVMERPKAPGLIKGSFLPECQTRITQEGKIC